MTDGPDFGAMLALINASKGTGGNGCAPGLAGIRLEQNVAAGLGLQAAAVFKADNTAKFANPRRNGPVAGLCEQMGLKFTEIAAKLSEMNQKNMPTQNFPVQQASMDSVRAPSTPVSSGGGIELS